MSFNCKKIVFSSFHLEQEIFKRYFDNIYGYLLDHLPNDWTMEKLNHHLYQVDSKQFITHLKQDPKNVGICLAAAGMLESAKLNQTQGIRAALVHTQYIAKMCRQHNDANVCIISTDCIGQKLAADLVLNYLKSDFDGQAKNKIRIGIVQELGQKYLKI